MKKLFVSMAVVAAATMVSCGNKADNATVNPEGTPDSVAVVEETLVVEEGTVVTEEEAPSLMENIKAAASKENVQKGIAYVKSLIESGKLAAARTYLEQIKPYADKVGMTSAVATVTSALEKAEGVAGKVKDQADSAVSNVQQRATEAVTDGVDRGVNAARNLLK